MVYPRRRILRTVLFKVFISHLHDETACTLSKFVDNTKLGQVVDKTDGCAAIQSWTGWRNALIGTSWKALHLGLTDWKTALQKRPWGTDRQVEHEPAMFLCGKEGQ